MSQRLSKEFVTACHEAGHAVGAVFLGIPFDNVSINDDDAAEGSVRSPLAIAEIRQLGLPWHFAIVAMLGREAERLVCGHAERRYLGNDAVTIARLYLTFFESEDSGIAMPTDQSLKPLWKVASKHLGLDPAAIEDDDVRKVLSGTTSLVDSIGSLRTHTGSTHGHGRRAYHLKARHARLAIHASHTLVGFFIETWDERKRKATS